jgi:replicative DNA helicase
MPDTMIETPRPGRLTVHIDQQFELEAEQRAIGLVLTRPNTWEAFAKLTADDFFFDEHALIWDAIEVLRATKQPADLAPVFLQLASQLGGRETPRAIEIKNYLMECVKSVVSVSGFEKTADTLKAMADKRRTAKCLENYARRLSLSGPTDPAGKIAGDLIHQLRVDLGDSGSMIDAGEIVQQIRRKKGKPVRVTSTGFPRLDKAWDGGLVENYYYVLAARKKSFKTTFLTSVAYQVIMRDDPEPIDFYCLESTAEQVFHKILSRWITEVWIPQNEPRFFDGLKGPEYDDNPLFRDFWNFKKLKINANAFRYRHVTEQPWFDEALARAEAFFLRRGLRFMSRPRMDQDDVVSEITSAGLSGNVRGIIFDYAQLVRPARGSKFSQTEHLDNVHQTFAELAGNLPLWVLAAVQINQTGGIRGGEGGNLAAHMVMHQHKVALPQNDGTGVRRYGTYLEMVDTRYTEEINVGDDGQVDEVTNVLRDPPAYHLIGETGPYLEEQRFIPPER